MKLNSYLLVAALAALVMVFSGCGDNTTDESGTTTTTTKSTTTTTKASGTTTTTKASGTTTTTTSSTTTTTKAVSAGEAQYKTSCGGCHVAKDLAKLTMDGIKSSNMTMGLSDDKLQLIVDYLATL